MSLIGASVVLNIAYDRLPGVGAEAMPAFLAHMYESSGKTAVTVVFVALGLGVMLFGLALPKSDEERLADAEARINKTRSSASTGTESAGHEGTSPDDPNAPTTTPDGQIILRTQQYLRRKSGPSR
jgi:hypothetical protein